METPEKACLLQYSLLVQRMEAVNIKLLHMAEDFMNNGKEKQKGFEEYLQSHEKLISQYQEGFNVLQSYVKNADKKHEQANQELQQIKEKLHLKEKENQSLQLELNNLGSSFTELRVVEDTIQQKDQEILQLKERLATREKEFKSLQWKCSLIIKSVGQIESLQNRLQQKDQEIFCGKENLASKEKEIQCLNLKLGLIARPLADLESLQNKLKEQNQEIFTLKCENREITQRIQEREINLARDGFFTVNSNLVDVTFSKKMEIENVESGLEKRIYDLTLQVDKLSKELESEKTFRVRVETDGKQVRQTLVTMYENRIHCIEFENRLLQENREEDRAYIKILLQTLQEKANPPTEISYKRESNGETCQFP